MALIDEHNISHDMTMDQVMASAGMISRIAFAKTQYGKVANDTMFKKIYDVEERWLDYIQGGVLMKKLQLSAPCMICGLVLPMRNLSIDHQRPQTGGEIEAVLKTFRAFGLTMEGPQGPKGLAIRTHVTEGKVLKPVFTKPGRSGLGGNNLADRYTLSDVGTVLYSFIAAAGETEQLRTQCMHGLLNLKPACQTCNSARGNPLKFEPEPAIQIEI